MPILYYLRGSCEEIFTAPSFIYEVTREELLLVKGIGVKRVNSMLAALRLIQIYTQQVIIVGKNYISFKDQDIIYVILS